MAKTSSIQKNLKRIRLSKKFSKKRESLKKIIKNRKLPLTERFEAQLKLAKIPRNSARTRIRNRCEITGLARMVRSYVVPALENISLWHERDISHSSVERNIGPDSTSKLNFLAT